ncbi:MAG: dihydroorotase family protein [Nitrososphaerota archaeon]|nr:dihydroorotase family protein [Candidatus Bathyarchaeota archaeon]MDW8023262.1 dihydroorotase family protein [Nitrososphaerota archaeon]
MDADLVLRDLKAYVNGAVAECCLAIKNRKILKIGKEASMPMAEKTLSLKGLLVLPGLIDVHVHLRDEGKAYKEDFYSGTAAAAAGGITTVLDMPNNNPVTMSAETLKNRMKAAEKKVLVNVGFYSEFPQMLQEISQIMKEGAVAFKLFMGEQVGGLNVEDDLAIKEAFINVGRKTPIAVHAEDKILVKNAEKRLRSEGCNDVEAFLKAHSEEAEVKAIQRVVAITKKTGTHVHFCHLSSEEGLKAVAEAKKAGLPVTCEATPHHLFLSVEDLKRLGGLALTVPPVREKHHAETLWRGVKAGLVDLIASDHAPHALDEKNASDIWQVKTGIPGLETTLPLLLNEVNNGRLTIADIVRLTAENPARIFHLKDRGSLKEGGRADFVVVDLKRKHVIEAAKFYSKAKYSPFNGVSVRGKPVKTFVGGKLVMDDDEIVAEAEAGEIICGEAKHEVHC